MGYVYENVVAQMLRTVGHKLCYHTVPHNSGKKNYEIDFLLSGGYKVSPIEVKSSGYKTHTSLDVFCRKYHSRILDRYVIYTKELHQEYDTNYIPVYMTMFL